MSMLPKLEETILTSDGYTKVISTMGDTTHVMVNGFCYHISQMQNGELKDACKALLNMAKEIARDGERKAGFVNKDGTIEQIKGEY